MDVTLYQFPHCPFCAKARRALDEAGIAYTKVDVAQTREDPQRQALHEKSGVWTVPVLKVAEEGEERYLGESDAIVAWARKG